MLNSLVPMSLQPNNVTGFNFIGKAQLVKLRSKAIRAGLWFRTLSRLDRVLIDLTIKTTNNVHSAFLASRLLLVAGKLEGLLESRLMRATREFGLTMANKLSLLAQKWGNKAAREWAGDEKFARYWAMTKLNEHSCTG